MNIQTVADNLRNTITTKEQMLTEFESITLRRGANLEAVFATKEILKINIAELKRILEDLESCIEKDVKTKGWVCPRCGVDRTKTVCPHGYTATVEGKCPMIAVAQ